MIKSSAARHHVTRTVLLALAGSACSAIPSLIKSQVPTPSVFGRGGMFVPLSTKLADARPSEAWLEIIDPRRRARPEDIAGATIPAQLGAGYFEVTVKSFCLHAGVPANARGEGYALAPYKGVRADVLRHVIERSARHPEFPQSDVQVLLWSIEYGHKFEELPRERSAMYRVLLDESDIATMSIDTAGLESFARATFGAGFTEFGTKLDEPNVPFSELERVAVPVAPAPKDLGPSRWTFVGHGLYVRATSHAYSSTKLELYRPQPYQVERDAANRIVSITSGQTRATIRTDRKHGHGVAFQNLATGHELFVPDSVLDPKARRMSRRASNAALFGFPDELSTERVTAGLETFKTIDELKENYEAVKRAIEFAQQSKDPAAVNERGLHALDEMQTTEYMNELLIAAYQFPDLKAKMFEIQKHLYNLVDVGMYVICQLRGQCTPTDPAGNDGDAATGAVAVPFNNGYQRLGLSLATFGP